MGIYPFAQELIDNQITISSISPCAVGAIPLKAGGTADVVGSTTAILIPFRISRPIIVVNMFIYMGAANGNNVDLGIFDIDGKMLIHTGNTAEGTASQIQTIAVSSTELGPGTYYMGHSESGATGSIKGQTLAQAGFLQAIGMCQAATSNPLVDLTLASCTGTQIPLMGLTTRSIV